MDLECSSFWKLYLDYLLSKQGGLFILKCNYDVNQMNIPLTFYYELLSWWSDLRESADPDRGYKFILWNNNEILIGDKTVFYRHYFNNGVIFIKDLLFDKTNTESFSEMEKQGLTNTNFLVWTGLRQSVPPNLRGNIPDFEEDIDIQNYKCRNYYCHLIKLKYERPRKWDKLGQEFDLREDQISEAYL